MREVDLFTIGVALVDGQFGSGRSTFLWSARGEQDDEQRDKNKQSKFIVFHESLLFQKWLRVTCLNQGDGFFHHAYRIFCPRSLRLFETTKMLLDAMAPAANIGLRIPNTAA